MDAGLGGGPTASPDEVEQVRGLGSARPHPQLLPVLLGVTRPHTEGTCSAAWKQRCCGPTDDSRAWGDLQALSRPKGFAI